MQATVDALSADAQGSVGLVADKVERWVADFILLLPNLLVALLLLFGFWLLARIVRRIVRGVMDRVSSYGQVNYLLATSAYIGVLVVGALLALGVLDLDRTVTSILAGAGIVGLALGFAFQDIAANFISGVFISVRRPFREGDIVETNEYLGVVADINLRTTEVRTFQGQLVLIPNSQVFQQPLVNYTKSGRRRIDLSCGVAYGDDLEKARRVALEAVRGVEMRDPRMDVDLYFEGFGDSSIDFTVRFWVHFARQTDFLAARSEAIIRLKTAFDEAGITIPFPIRTLDFGVVGGEKLNEVLPRRFYADDHK